MKIQTIAGYLPIFTGFYGSISEEVFIERDENDEFDYKKYQVRIARKYVRLINNELDKLNNDLNIHFVFEKIESPRFYNFSNDEIQTKTSFYCKAVLDYVNNNFSKFNDYCKKNFTSCDGFCSFYPNKAEEFLRLLDTDKRKAVLNHIIDFIVCDLVDADEIEEKIQDFCYEVELEE